MLQLELPKPPPLQSEQIQFLSSVFTHQPLQHVHHRSGFLLGLLFPLSQTKETKTAFQGAG